MPGPRSCDPPNRVVVSMLPKEATLIGTWLQGLGLESGSVCLNIGSSTRHFREYTQPFIYNEVLKPLELAGCVIVNCDLKEDDGVDEVGDLLDTRFQRRLAQYNASLLICSNLLEHLTDPATFAGACGSIVKPGGYCVFTVPRSFPYHPDPQDTMFRPTPEEIITLLPAFDVVDATEIAAGSYGEELSAGPSPKRALLRQIVRSMMPFYRPAKWYPATHKLFWLFRAYRVSAVLFRKPAVS